MKTGVQHFLADDCIDSRDHTGLNAGCQQDAMDQVAGSGLAIRAGHTDHHQLAAWVVMESCTDPGQAAPGILHLQIGNRETGQLDGNRSPPMPRAGWHPR